MREKKLINIVVGKAIRNRREELNMSIQNLALLMGITRSFLSQIETGRSGLTLLNLALLKKHIDLDVIKLLKRIENIK